MLFVDSKQRMGLCFELHPMEGWYVPQTQNAVCGRCFLFIAALRYSLQLIWAAAAAGTPGKARVREKLLTL
jgi:hypothetical protein